MVEEEMMTPRNDGSKNSKEARVARAALARRKEVQVRAEE